VFTSDPDWKLYGGVRRNGAIKGVGDRDRQEVQAHLKQTVDKRT
jgi:hypothetical protein